MKCNSDRQTWWQAFFTHRAITPALLRASCAPSHLLTLLSGPFFRHHYPLTAPEATRFSRPFSTDPNTSVVQPKPSLGLLHHPDVSDTKQSHLQTSPDALDAVEASVAHHRACPCGAASLWWKSLALKPGQAARRTLFCLHSHPWGSGGTFHVLQETASKCWLCFFLK